MAKPINPYQGPEPAAMKYMGAGILEAGANIGRTLQGGYESMGKGIASGITAAADAYKQYKDTQSEIKASEKSYETMKSFLPEEVRKKFDEEIKSLNKSDTTSLRDKAAFWNQAKSFIGSSVGQAFQMNKQKAELDAAAARQAAALEEERMAPFRKQAASLLNNPMTGTDFGVGQGLIAPTKRQRTNFFEDLQ